MKKKLLTVLSATALSLSMCIPAFAGQWVSNTTGWWWQNDDGSWPANSWQWLDGNKDGVSECYYFGQNGYLLVNTTTPDGYKVNADGAWTENGVVQTKVVATTAKQENTAATNAQATDDYSGTYLEKWSDGTVSTQTIVYNPADKTKIDTRTVNGNTYVEKYSYMGVGLNGWTCFELVSDTDKGGLYFSAPGVMETGYTPSIHRQ